MLNNDEIRVVLRPDSLMVVADQFKNEYDAHLSVINEFPVYPFTDYETQFGILLTRLYHEQTTGWVPEAFAYLSEALLLQIEALVIDITFHYQALDDYKLLYVKHINALILEPEMGYTNLVVDAVVNFEIIPAAIIKTVYEGVTVLGVVSAAIARTHEDVAAKHQQVKAYLPVGSPNHYTDYNYVLVKLPNSGVIHAIGLPWIKESTIVLSSKRSYSFICDNVEPTQLETIRQVLLKNGVTVRSVAVYNG